MHPLETYLRDLLEIRSTGAAVPETSYYGALANLLNEVGHELSPRVRCVINLQNRGAGIPDGGLFTADQFQRRTGEIKQGQAPARGVIEVKPVTADAWVTAAGEQVTRYWGRYGLVLVTNYRDFVLVGRDVDGSSTILERYRLADDENDFWRKARGRHDVAAREGERFIEFLKRVLLHEAPISTPEELAWFLASYAREAKLRVDAGGTLPALGTIRESFERALGITFTAEQGNHFFRSSLVQTLFYGVFSSWVLWSGRHRHDDHEARYEWRDAVWDLHVPMITALYEQIATPRTLRPLQLEEVLNWTGAVLNRVDRGAFFTRFAADEAVQHFYEPFLQEFDPELRKQLGVWYTPREIVQYQVARVDAALKDELGIAEGLADDNVFVLDPCCGTGAYLVEVLRHIQRVHEARGGDALSGGDLKAAALRRIYGFELLPAPFVVAHLQLGLLLQQLGAPLAPDRAERIPVFLTNALTGWEPPAAERAPLLFAELEEERTLSDGVKRGSPILVILGNPPYDSFTEVAEVEEERSLTTAYGESVATRQPEGQGLNDLYVRFFRMAERRIVEMTGRGVISFVSNYSWLDGLSHPAMRERYLAEFDSIRIDSLNGDRNRTGKVTPTGEPDPSAFSTRYNPQGIKVGTAVTLLVRKATHMPAQSVMYRDFWGRGKRQQLLEAATTTTDASYGASLVPRAELGFPFVPVRMAAEYTSWPTLTTVIPTSFAGVKTSRDDALIAVDRDRLVERFELYFDPAVSHEEMSRIAPTLMVDSGRFRGVQVREQLRRRGLRREGFMRYMYRPFDTRWLYWEGTTDLLDRKRAEYVPHVCEANLWIEARQKQAMDDFDRGTIVRDLADNLGNGLSSYFPLYLTNEGTIFADGSSTPVLTPNLSPAARLYVRELESSERTLFLHVAAVLHSPAYRHVNAGALRLDWPRIPMPRLAGVLERSASVGNLVATLFDTSTLAPGVTADPLRPELRTLASVRRVGGGQLNPATDLEVAKRWGYFQSGVVFPGPDSAVERARSDEEISVLAQGAAAIGMTLADIEARWGATTYDVPLNDIAVWANVPKRVWEFTASNYAVLKKWLSYRESAVLGRNLRVDEAREFTGIARRIAALLLLGPALDASYEATTADAVDWAAIEAGVVA